MLPVVISRDPSARNVVPKTPTGRTPKSQSEAAIGTYAITRSGRCGSVIVTPRASVNVHSPPAALVPLVAGVAVPAAAAVVAVAAGAVAVAPAVVAAPVAGAVAVGADSGSS